MGEKLYLGGVTNTTLTFEDGKIHVQDTVDAAPIMDYAAAMRNHRFDAYACDGMIRHEGEIPMTVFQDECRKRGLPVQGALGTELGDQIIDAILRDPQYAKFRAAPTVRDPRIILKGAR